MPQPARGIWSSQGYSFATPVKDSAPCLALLWFSQTEVALLLSEHRGLEAAVSMWTSWSQPFSSECLPGTSWSQAFYGRESPA